MSENIQSISQGTYTIGQTSATNFIAGPGIKIDEPSAGTVRIGNDETVLYSATPKIYGGTSSGETIQLSESISSFERLRFYLNVAKKSSSAGNMTYYDVCEIDNFSGSAANFQYGPFPENNVTANWFILKAGITDNICNVSATYNASTSVQNPHWGNKWFPGSLYKIVGVNRKEV